MATFLAIIMIFQVKHKTADDNLHVWNFGGFVFFYPFMFSFVVTCSEMTVSLTMVA